MLGAHPTLNLAPFGRWTLRDKAAQRRLATRWASLNLGAFMRKCFSRFIVAAISAIWLSAHATSPMPIDLELSMDVKTEERKQSVFDIVRARTVAQGFSCKELPTKTFGRDVLIMHCVKSSEYPAKVHSITASDNLGLALFKIDGYFGGAPEPVSTLVATIEHDVKQIGGITVRAMRTHTDRSVDSSEAQAQRELAKRAVDHWRQMCADKPSHPACPQSK